MKNLIIALGIFSLGFGQDAYPYAIVNGDTVEFGMMELNRNCGALFVMDAILEDSIFTITATDTGDLAFCYCTFDVNIIVYGIEPGNYTAQFYTYDLSGMMDSLQNWLLDTTYVGQVSFTVSGNGTSPVVLSSNQTDCYFIESEPENLPNKFVLFNAYPNPFNSTTTIAFQLPESGIVNLSIYDINGRLVENLINRYTGMGSHRINWNAGEFASGIYLIKLTTEIGTKSRKILLLK